MACSFLISLLSWYILKNPNLFLIVCEKHIIISFRWLLNGETHFILNMLKYYPAGWIILKELNDTQMAAYPKRLACLKLAGPYSKGWVILKKLCHTRVWCSQLGNTQNLGISEFPKVFQNPFLIVGEPVVHFGFGFCASCDPQKTAHFEGWGSPDDCMGGSMSKSVGYL